MIFFVRIKLECCKHDQGSELLTLQPLFGIEDEEG